MAINRKQAASQFFNAHHLILILLPGLCNPESINANTPKNEKII